MTIRALFRALRLLVAPRSVERDVDAEITSHLELLTQQHIHEGMSPLVARHEAEREFGSAGTAKADVLFVHAHPGTGWLDGVLRDLAFALRSLSRQRFFAGTTMAILTLGVATATVILAITSGVLLRPLPFRSPDRLAMIWGDYPVPSLAGIPEPEGGLAIQALQDHGQAFESIAGFVSRPVNWGSGADAERIDGAAVSADFFQTIGVDPTLGRGFHAEEELPGAHVVVVGWGLWQRKLGGDPNVIGRPVLLDGESYTVVGVAPRGFDFPEGAEMPRTFVLPAQTDLWIAQKPPLRGPSEHLILGRMKPGTTIQQAQLNLNAVAGILERQLPQAKGWFNTRAVALPAQIVGDVRPMLIILLCAAAVLLAIACLNATQLFLTRLQSRRGELAIRAILGAEAPRLARLLLFETVLLTGGAGVAGAAIGAATLGLVRHWAAGRLPRAEDLTFGWGGVACAVLVTAAAAVAFAAAPAFAAVRLRLSETLRRTGRGGGTALRQTTRRALIVAELALSVVLVTGSGLLIKSLAHQLDGPMGFTASHAVAFEVSLPLGAYPETQGPTFKDHPRGVQFITEALARLRAIPGVTAAAIGKPLPVSGAEETTVFVAEGSEVGSDATQPVPIIEYTIASPGMFSALGGSLLRGRDFDDGDRINTPAVVILNESAARWLWPGQDAVGKRVRLGTPASPSDWMTVIGVARDMKRYSLTKAASPEMIVPYTQRPYPTFATMQFVMRSALPAAQLAAPISAAIAGVDPAVPVARLRGIEDLVQDAAFSARFAAATMSSFGLAALALAMIGLYGVIAYAVHQRRQEFGVRLALGATRGDIVRLVLKDGLWLTALGVLAGVGVAFAVDQSLHSLLYQVSAADPITILATVCALVGVALVASAVPASQAGAVSPRVALEEA